MNKIAWRLSSLACATPALVASDFARADIVYSGFSTPQAYWVLHDTSGVTPAETDTRVESPGGTEREAQAAQLVQLAGTARLVTLFEVRLVAFGPANPPTSGATVHLTLYASEQGLPGAALWTGSVPGVTVNNGVGGFSTVAFAPQITVPDSFFFALALSAITNPSMGFGPAAQTASPTVGTRGPGVYLQDSATLAWSVDPFSLSPPFNLQARVTAVPSPATVLIALAPLVWRRRRS